MMPNEELRKHLLSLKDGWGDNDGNKAFLPWQVDNAISFAERVVSSVERSGNHFFRPVISPCDGNTIDIHWRDDNVQLLVNIDQNGASAYGHKIYREDTEISLEGELNEIEPYIIEWIVSILKEIHPI